ncbi:gliding motility-associated lipoprotein GldH [Parabacteroides sp. PFB2-12]|uniref:gliding motility lipoprotein GldH n=1 Tax=unclassified Parabacteroides TaxID=2649774 RepID=UPI0024753326|nr:MULTISPECIES: gliding motility lipoprotein GldH [unclassified Parabacteroides]MDH6341279.1 gliding motility-associated lipoprotein GldH [Parabacteroides sp. PM6-13]MDH6389071.1 gliding motility-associated lipoprotein GldH [Parabacteroides sp. PFB2-12]
MKKGIGNILIWIGAGCLLLSSCDNRVIYDKYLTLEERNWDKEKEYFFLFQIDDNTIPYDLTFEVRNNNLYPFQNLWVFIEEQQPSGEVKRDTLECMLADDFGKWLGDGMSVHELSFPLRTHYQFPDTGTYSISFRQGMRKEILPGIQQLGLRIETSNR